MPTLLFKTKVLLRSLFGEGVWKIVQRCSSAPRHRLIRLCQRETRQIVRGGPFAGMNYIHDTMSGGYVPKVLGIYERELHPVIARLAELGIQRVLNIGAADGYYAVGLCRMFPDLRVVAFETEARGREYVRAMAERNGVLPRVEIRGTCDLPGLQAALTDPRGTLVLCDVEGYEDVLMDPEKVPGLRAAWLLVELHDGKNPGVSGRIRARFEQTHTIETIWQTKRTAADFPFSNAYTRSLAPEHLAAAVDEGRPVRDGVTPMSWFWMVPKRTQQ
jgi:hypothetical protein